MPKPPLKMNKKTNTVFISLIYMLNFNAGNDKKNFAMKKNMGTVDKIIRIIAALLAAWLIYTNVFTGTLAIIIGIFAGAFVITSLIGFCPLYVPLGLRTCRKKADS